jgi:hypothetical protein
VRFVEDKMVEEGCCQCREAERRQTRESALPGACDENWSDEDDESDDRRR